LAEGTVTPDASDRGYGRGYGTCSAINCVCVSLSLDRCLMVLHQVCRAVALDRKKLTVLERCRSNHRVSNIVDAFGLMQERKCVCGEQPKIRNLQQNGRGCGTHSPRRPPMKVGITEYHSSTSWVRMVRYCK